jgi:tRNA U34 5-methylaminomethyl-2-thiouridine-forming methyltransferase MnmC
LKRKIITTADGSKTIHIEDWNEQYHSKHGAIQEAQHVFIKEGLQHYSANNKSTSVDILEIGFGTGLNAFLTLLEADNIKSKINYVGVEAYPVSMDDIDQLNYVELISAENETVFNKLHTVSWEKEHEITSKFKLQKRQQFF